MSSYRCALGLLGFALNISAKPFSAIQNQLQEIHKHKESWVKKLPAENLARFHWLAKVFHLRIRSAWRVIYFNIQKSESRKLQQNYISVRYNNT